MEHAEYVTRVLAVFAEQRREQLSWTVDGSVVSFRVCVPNAFGDSISAWYEDLTPERLPTLERAHSELKPLRYGDYTAALFIARVRGTRPLPGSFPYQAKHLLDGLPQVQ